MVREQYPNFQRVLITGRIVSFYRIWRDRRLVLTKEDLFLARNGALSIIDTIPLHEIDGVMEMNEETEQKTRSVSTATDSKMNRDSPSTHSPENCVGQGSSASRLLKRPDGSSRGPTGLSGSSNRISYLQAQSSSILQIKTTINGRNAGKTYYVSTRANSNPEQCRQSIVLQLNENIRIARRNAEAKSRFQRSQERVQHIQSSFIFQLVMALFIMLVMPTIRSASIAFIV